MDELLLKAVVAALLLVIAILLGVIFYFILRHTNLIKRDHAQNQAPLKTKDNKEGVCLFHPNELARSQCAICQELLCEHCNRDYEHLHFCPHHFELYLSHRWKPLTTHITNAKSPQQGIAIYQFKEKLWASNKLPSFVVTNYKIDVETDEIESYIQLYVREEDYFELSKQYSDIAGKDTRQ